MELAYNAFILLCFGVNFALCVTLFPIWRNSPKNTSLFYYLLNNTILSAFPIFRSMTPARGATLLASHGAVPFWAIMAPLFLEFCLCQTERRTKTDQAVQVVTFIVSCSVLALHIFSDTIIRDYISTPYGVQPVFGPFTAAFVVASVIPGVLYGLWLLLEKARNTEEYHVRASYYSVIAGVLLIFLAGLITDVAFPSFSRPTFMPRLAFSLTAIVSLILFRAFKNYYMLDIFMNNPVSRLFTITADGIIILDSTGAVIAMNSSARNLLKLPDTHHYACLMDISPHLGNMLPVAKDRPAETILTSLDGHSRICARFSPAIADDKYGKTQIIVLHNLTAADSKIDSLSRHLNIRNEIWRHAGNQTGDINALTQNLLESIGRGFGVSRASYVEEQNGRFICITEWCASGIRPSRNHTLASDIIKKLFHNGPAWLCMINGRYADSGALSDHEKSEEALHILRKGKTQPVEDILDAESAKEVMNLFHDIQNRFMYVYPFFRSGNISRLFTLDITDSPTLPTLDELEEFSRLDSQIMKDSERILDIISARIDSEKAMLFSGRLAGVGATAAGISHELKNIVFLIRNLSDMLARYPDVDDAARSMNRRIRIAALRAESITKNVLSYSVSPKLELAEHQINDILQETLELVDELLCSNQIDVNWKPGECPQITCDRNQISQVFLNLILNCINVLKGCAFRQLFICTSSTETHVFITIEDSGPGVPKEQIPRLFDPFFTVRTTNHAGTGSGTGLGLSVSKTIIMNHSGFISASNRDTGGATFNISLPLTPQLQTGGQNSSPVHHGTPDTEAQPAKILPTPRKIMVLDDERDIVDILNLCIAEAGHDAYIPENAEHGLQMIKAGNIPDVVILDWVMPGISGAEFMEQVARYLPADKVPDYILVTGIHKNEILEQLGHHKTAAILTKPFDVNSLIAML